MTAADPAAPPLFTVVMSTYGRGRHIVPSIRSVLAQDMDDYEFLVIGDGCTDETAQIVAQFAAQGVRWRNLVPRWGSQSGPNNDGIAVARGQIIAYIGHDDIWEPFHLSSLARLYAERPEVGFGVGGAIFHRPNGIPGSEITGLFDQDEDKHIHFFPPTSFSHRRSVIDRIGGWNRPDKIAAPVDVDFLLRAAYGDIFFTSTGRISVHKFAAGHRYLSYLEQTSNEQAAMLADLAQPGHAQRIAAIVQESRALGRFMSMRHTDHSGATPGSQYRNALQSKGIQTAAPTAVGPGVAIDQTPAHCGLDWREKINRGIRWNLFNPRPRLLLPHVGGDSVLWLFVAHKSRKALKHLRLNCNATEIPVRRRFIYRARHGWRGLFRARLKLRPDAPSVLEFLLEDLQLPSTDTPLSRIGIGRMFLVPADPTSGTAQTSLAALALRRRFAMAKAT